MKNETTSLKKEKRHWDIFLKISLFNDLYEKNCKIQETWIDNKCVLTKEEKDQVVVAWVLSIQKVGRLSIDQQ